MYKCIEVLTHSSIRIKEESVIYIDPFMVNKNYNDADIIFITHNHPDHFSINDIKKVIKENTIFVLPESIKLDFENSELSKYPVNYVKPYEKYQALTVKFETIPAYNVNKPMHPKSNNWVGYLFDLSIGRCYIAGDTDDTSDAYKVKCDIALLPIGGKYTMDGYEAAKLCNAIKPKIVIPTHFGKLMGNDFFKKIFHDNVSKEITVIDEI